MALLRARLGEAIDDLRGRLHAALAERHTPGQVAGSFAVGVFVTSLPTLGTGLLLFPPLAYLCAGISKVALVAAAAVMNPVVKWGVYGVSFWLGSRILGPVEGVTRGDIGLSAAPEIVARLLVGNLLLAVVCTVVGYVVAYRLTVEYRQQNGGVGCIEGALEAVFGRR